MIEQSKVQPNSLLVCKNTTCSSKTQACEMKIDQTEMENKPCRFFAFHLCIKTSFQRKLFK